MNGSEARPASRPPLSAAIICQNEEENIGRCLAALRWCEQIVVVDGGSRDRTPEIVRQHPGAQLFQRPFDNFIDQRNHALDLCRHDWVLAMDADEVVTEALAAEIQELPLDVEGYRIGRRSFIGDREVKHGTWSPDYQLRLFRRSRARWGGTNPHESVILDGRVGRLKARMLHYSYRSREEFVERNRRYVQMMVGFLHRQGRTTNALEPFVHWVGNFCKAYLLRGGFLDGSLGLFLARHQANGSFQKYRLLAARLRESSAG